jgi:hypothetical protein
MINLKSLFSLCLLRSKKPTAFFDEFFGDDSDDPIKKKERKEINKGASRLGFSSWGDDKAKPAFDKDVLGICHDCQKLQCYKTKWGNMGARCYDFDIVQNPQDPIEDCTNYLKDKQLTLAQMIDMATMIDPDGKNNQIGFVVEKK